MNILATLMAKFIRYSIATRMAAVIKYSIATMIAQGWLLLIDIARSTLVDITFWTVSHYLGSIYLSSSGSPFRVRLSLMFFCLNDPCESLFNY